jgi:ATP-dependent Zn protease
MLTGRPPYEVKVNPASLTGGYMLPDDKEFSVVTNIGIKSKITVLMAGRAAEIVIFVKDSKSSGCSSDINNATNLAGNYIRNFGMDKTVGIIDASSSRGTWWNTN